MKTFVLPLCAVLLAGQVLAAKNDGPFQKSDVLKPISRIELKSAEIAAYMPEAKKLFVVGEANTMEVVDLSDAVAPMRKTPFSLDGEATSVTAYGRYIAVSLLANPSWKTGSVELLELDSAPDASAEKSAPALKKLGTYKVCHQPDMLTFTPDGKKILVACEGEPSEDGLHDPFGGIAFLDVANILKPEISIDTFPDSTIEPEYITVSKDSKTAWVSLQENNAVAKIDIANKRIDQIFDLGYVDHSKPGFGLDAVKDGKIRIANENIWGLRQPDGVKTFEVNGKHYLLTANEGAEVAKPESIYGLKGLSAKAGSFKVRSGSRSVSLFDGMNGKLLWDSGELLEHTFADVAPGYFNWNSKKGKKKVDARSDDMGCEPENVTVGEIRASAKKGAAGKDRRLAFVGLERMSGVAVFDLTDVENAKTPVLLDYYMDPADRGPEGLLFIPAEESPIPGQPLLVVGYEYSKTLVIYSVK